MATGATVPATAATTTAATTAATCPVVEASPTAASTPTVTVSRTSLPEVGATEVTVTGSGFDPAAVTGTRPPLAGTSGGVYVAFGSFAASWQPSAGAPSSSRVTGDVRWAVLAEDMATIGGPQAGAVELTPEGTFTTTLSIDKAVVDAKTTSADGRYGIYTYPGSGAVAATHETYTPLTFGEECTPVSIAVTGAGAETGTARTTHGSVETLTVSVPGATGVVTLTGLDEELSAELVGGAATLSLPDDVPAGRRQLTIGYAGDAAHAPATSDLALVVAKARPTVAADLKVRPTKNLNRLRVDLGATDPTGTATVRVRGADGATVLRKKVTLRQGRASAPAPKRGGAYVAVVRYSGDANHRAVTRRVGFTVR